MSSGHVGRWEGALSDFTKESFEAEGGKRRDVFRAGVGPAVIVMSEAPGITPELAVFGRRVVAAGCTAVLPQLFGDPGRPTTGGYAVGSLAPACVSRKFVCFALKRTSPITMWLRALAPAEHARVRRPGRRRGRHVLHRRVHAGDDGRRRGDGPGAESAVAAVPDR